MDMAVGIIVEAAFTAIVKSLMGDLIMAFVVFMLVRYVNKVKKAVEAKEEAAAVVEETPAGPTEIELLGEIRDVLKAKG